MFLCCAHPNFVSTHSRPKAAGKKAVDWEAVEFVSTHSRPKAAGNTSGGATTAPPFQLTAARRRLGATGQTAGVMPPVSTHSRPKAAGRVD